MSVTEIQKNKEPSKGTIEIRLKDIIQALKTNWRRILIGGFLGLLVGALYAFSKPNIFKSTVTLMPEIQSRGAAGGLGSLAGLAGINIDNLNGQDAIRPELYPNVLQSIPFAAHLLKQEVYSNKLKAKVTFQKFIDQTSGNWFGKLIASLLPAGSGTTKVELADPQNFSKAIQLTTEQYFLLKGILASIDAQYDKKTGILTVTSTQTDPVVAATTARLAMEYLTNYIIGYRTEKARRQVDFLTQRVGEAKSRYQAAEYAISSYRDRNRSVYLETAKINEQRLQADYLLEQAVYNELSKQLEQAKIKVQEETPVFKVLEPPILPVKKSGPSRTLIMLGIAIVGAGISALIALFRVRNQIFRRV